MQTAARGTINASAVDVPTYSIDYHVISAGGSAAENGCVRLSGTVGQTAPGYSGGSIYWLVAGFWAAPGSASDEIFFNGFQGCRA